MALMAIRSFQLEEKNAKVRPQEFSGLFLSTEKLKRKSRNLSENFVNLVNIFISRKVLAIKKF